MNVWRCGVSIYLSVAGCVVIVGYLIICPPEPDTHLAPNI